MSQTQSTPEGSHTSGAPEQAGRPGEIVTDRRAAERSRRSRRWARRELDALLDLRVPDVGTVDYAAMGFTLTLEQRRSAGRALLEQERAA